MIINNKEQNLKQRLDKFLTTKLPVTRSQIQKLIKAGDILVNNKPATVHRFLKLNDKIKINEKNIKDLTIKKELTPNPKVKFKIIFEDDDIIIIDKKSGQLVHPTDQMEGDTLVNGLLVYYPKIAKVGDNPLRPGIVHRLDKNVSGLMMVCKNQKSFEFFKDKFKNRKIKKIYTALVHGQMEKPEGTINLPIARSKEGRMAVRSAKQGGKKAITNYSVIKNFAHFSLLEVEILTGRTHQIRAHLNAIEHPVVGDPLYKQKNVKQNLDFDRPFLHSTILGFKDMNKQKHEFVSKLPTKLKKVVKELR